MNERVAAKLTALRGEYGFTIETLAVELGVPAAAVEAWESGVDLPNTPSLIKLAKLYDVSLDDLLLNERHSDDRHPSESRSGEYHSSQPEAHYERSDDSSENPGDYHFKIAGANVRISHAAFPYPIIVTAVYLIAGMLFNWWHPGWLIFLTIPLYYTMPDFDHEPLRSALLKFPYPVLVTLVYMSLGCFLGWWHPWWMLYLTVPLYYIFAAHMDRA